MAESGENPNPFAENAGGCFGLYQGCDGRSASLRAAFAAAGLQTSGGNVDKAIDVTLTHLVTADDGSFTTFVNSPPSANRPENYSDMFLVVVERAVGGSDPILDDNANARGGGGLYQHAAKRRNYAKSAYASFSGNTLQPSDTSTMIRTNTQTIMSQSDCPSEEGEGGGGVNVPEPGELVSGGMNFAQATAFMEKYRSIRPRTYAEPGGEEVLGKWQINRVDINKATNDCWSNLENCVAVVQWFICEYGGVCMGLPSGGQVVSTLLNSGRGFINGGITPKAYAIFSTPGTHGHTGVILGVDTDKGKVYIGEAGCDCDVCDFSFTGAKEGSLAEFSSGKYTYAYTDNIIHL